MASSAYSAEISGAETILRLLVPDCPERVAAGGYLLRAPPPEDCLSAEQKTIVRQGLSDILAQDALWRASWHLGLFYASLMQHYCDPELGTRHMLAALERCDDLSAALQLFFQIRVFCFSSGINTGSLQWQAYFRLCRKLFHEMALPQLHMRPVPKRAMILTAQMLQPPHQPTVDVLAMAKILNRDFGYDVAVLNSYENPARCELPVFGSKISQRMAQYCGFQRDSVSGVQIFTPTCEMPSAAGYQQVCAFAEAWKPAFILNFGSFNFSAEYLGRFCHVISMEAGTNFMPTRTARHLVTFRDLGPADHALLQKFAMQDIPRIRTTYCYGVPEIRRKYQRTDFSLVPEDVVLAVVGTRLGRELTDNNLRLFARVLAQSPKLKILIAGPLEAPDKARIQTSLPAQQLVFAGFVPDVPSLLDNVCDAFLNPVRTGGGGAAAYALAAGLPVFTLNVGHVAANTDPDFVYPSGEALCAAIRDFVAAPHREVLRRKARARFAKISDRRLMLRDILEGAGLPTDLKNASAA